MTISPLNVSVVLPCLNEHQSIRDLVRRLCDELPGAEILVVDDGSSPPIPDLEGAFVLRHAYNIGNGAAIKTGARHASRDFLMFLDADGQHDPRDISRLLEKFAEGYDLVVGARSMDGQASAGRWIANHFYNRFASMLT
ncbi:MAG: glycosyltransferase family 2 protein, partial [Gammaproteobacteria bacterium]|nr:glycosyltransferase family 2 protein [Gammaproteobacteria bacterium]